MNARCFKTVFSKRLSARVAVGEHTSSQGKATGAGGFAGDASQSGSVLGCVSDQFEGFKNGFWGALSSTFALVALVWAAPAWAQPAAHALPTGGQVVQGAVQFNQSAQQLNIQQSTDRAAVNWQSFDIGAAAKVNIQQPSAQSVLLNRVGGESPSQIFGQLQANGKVILVNPNGLVIGRDGSVSAAGFTGSTLNISDADFMAGQARFSRSGGVHGSVVNQGRIELSRGGYVALLGASVSNEGAIVAPQGHVFLAAADGVNIPAELPGPGLLGVPIGQSGRIRLELTPASINAAVANHKGGTIVTEGGQVYLQAAALNQAMATVLQSGSIDTTGVQGGQVHVLADGGRIRVDGQIKANSTGTDDKGQPKAGGDIFIGRDRDTNVLAAVGDVRGATLESKGGFVETSGDHLKTDGITVKTKDWLLDPSDITISNSADSNVTGTSPADITPNGGAGTSSIVNVGTIQTAINAGTSVTIKTTNASNPSGAGNITITDALSLNNTGAQDATLSLVADNGIIQNGAITATGTKLVHISMTADGNFQGNSAASASSQGITLNAGITSNGNITLTGNNQSSAAAGAGAGVHINGQTLNAGSSDVTVTGTATNSNGIYTNSATTIRGRNITLNGTANTTTAASVARGIYLFRDGTTTIASTNNLAITGSISGAGTGNGVFINGLNVGSAVLMTAGGTATIKGIQTGNANNTSSTLSLAGFRVNATGDVTLQAEAASSNSLAIYMNREAGSLNGYDDGWRMQVRSSGGNVLIQSNQGAVLGQDINGGVTISGRNVTLDNTGAGMTLNGVANANGGSINATTGFITLGSGTSTYSAAVSNGWAGSWVPLGVSLNGQNSTANLTATSNLTIGGSSSAAQGVVVATSITVGGNIQLASRTSAANTAGLTTSQALTAAGHIGLTGESTNASPGVGLNIGSTVSTTGNGSTTTFTSSTGAVSGAGNITTAASNTGAITVNSATAGILSGVISGGGSLVKQGAGTISLTGTNTFTGTTTISAGTLQLGNGGTTGSLGTNTGEITNNGTLAYNRSNNLTVSNTISGTGALMQAGTGTTILTANNSYSGTTTVSGGTLQVGNGGTTGTLGTGGAVTLSNNAVLSYVRSADTTIANNIAGTGSVSASITGVGSDLAVSHAIALTAGTVNLAADGHLSLAQGITTTNTTTSALVLNAGAAANAGTSSGGDISFTGSGAVSVGAGGRATLFTGSLSGSTGLGITVGNNRYNSDELTTNYTAALGSGTFAVYREAPTLNVRFNDASKTYDALAFTGGNGLSVVSGLVNGDTSTTFSGIIYSGTAQNATNAGSYAISGTAINSHGYALSYTNGTLTVNKANLVLTGTREYDATTTFAGQHLTATGVAGQTFSLTGSGHSSNLASKNVQSSQSLSSVTGLSLGASTNGGLSSNYNALSITGSSVSVTPLSASVSSTAASVVYNGSTQNQAVTSSGFIAGDDVVISGWASGKAAGSYGSNLSLTGADAANYSVTFHNANWVITPAPLVVSATAVTKTYDGKLKATGSGTVGVLAGAPAGEEVLSAGVQSFLDKDAGTGKTVRASGVKIKDSSGQDVTVNYAISYVDNTSSTINKAILAITANDDARFVTQSDAMGFNGVSYAGLVGGETSSVLGGSLTIARTNSATQDAGSYSGVLVPSGLTSNNYQISFVNGNYTIIPANQLLIRTANLTGSSSVVYGSATNFDATAQYLDSNNQVIHTLSRTGSNGLFTFSDGANGAVSVALKPYIGSHLASTSTSGHTVVGNYAIQDLSPLVTGGNFSGSPIFVGALQVDPKAVTPNATGVAKTYDGTTSMNNVVVGLTGKLGNDDLSISGSGAFSQRHVGTGLAYTISDVVLAGADAANYYLMGGSNSFSGNDGVISRAPLVISTANVVKTYDRTTNALGQAVPVQGTQLFSGDSFSGGTFAFTNANAGSGNKTVTVSGVAVNDGNGGGNYSISFANNTSSTIQARALQANFAASSKVYDGTDMAQVTGNTADVIAGDTVFLVKTGAVFNDKNVGAGKSVTVSGISLSGADAANYSLLNTSALSSADITPKPLTVSFSTSDRAYDGSTTASVLGSSADKLAGDHLVFNASSAQFASADAGVNKQVTLTGLSLGGADAGNYALQNTSANSTGTIDPRDVSLTGLTAANKVYDGTTSAVITSGVIATGVSGESLNVTGTGTFASKHVGSNKSVTVADVSALTKVNGTGHWNNYRLITTGSLSTHATITPLSVTAVVNAQNKVYDGTTEAQVGGSVVGALAGDVVGVSTGSANFASKNVVRDAAGQVQSQDVTVSGIFLTGPNATNYNLTTTSLVTRSSITPKLLQASGVVADKVYDGNATASLSGLNGTGLLAGDSVSVEANIARFEDKRVSRDARGAVVTKLVTVEGLRLVGTDAGNYALVGSSLTARAKILPRPLDVLVSAQDKVYDGNAVATGSLSLSHVVEGDVLALSWGRGSFDSKDVLRNAQGGVQAQGVRFESVRLSGADSGNYSLKMDTALGMATITPKRLEVIGTQVADKKEDGSVRADVRMGVLSGLVGSEQLRALASGQFRAPGAGQNQPVDVIYSLQDGENGGKAGNYELMGQTLKASITPVNALQMPRTEAPVASENTRSRVFFDQSRWASFAPAQSSEGRKGERSVDSSTCSAQTPNNCSCNVDMGTGVEICLPVRDR